MITTPIVIHVGTGKTGTTFLQYNFFNKLDDICYIGQSPETMFNYDKNMRFLTHSNFSAINEEEISKIKKFLESYNSKNLPMLISDEGYFFSINENFLRMGNSCINIKKIFSTPRIIFTFRKQDDFIESFYRECIFKGYHTSAFNFIGYRNGIFSEFDQYAENSIDVKTLNWNSTINFLDSFFGRDNVLALPYELLRDNPHDFSQRITTFLGTPLPEVDFCQKTNETKANKNYLALRIMRFLNRFACNGRNGLPLIFQDPLHNILPEETNNESAPIKKIRQFSRYLSLRSLATLIAKFPTQNKNFFNAKVRAKIMKLHSEGNIHLSKRVDVDLSHYNYY